MSFLRCGFSEEISRYHCVGVQKARAVKIASLAKDRNFPCNSVAGIHCVEICLCVMFIPTPCHSLPLILAMQSGLPELGPLGNLSILVACSQLDCFWNVSWKWNCFNNKLLNYVMGSPRGYTNRSSAVANFPLIVSHSYVGISYFVFMKALTHVNPLQVG